MDQGKIHTSTKYFNERWKVEKVISVDDYKGKYIYQAKHKDNSYIVKGFKIQLMNTESREDSEISKEGLEQMREIYEEYFFMKATSCLSPYIAKPLAMNYIIDGNTTIEVILDCTGNTLNNLTIESTYKLMKQSVIAITLFYNLGIPQFDINPNSMMCDAKGDLMFINMGNAFTLPELTSMERIALEYAPPELLQSTSKTALTLPTNDSYFWAMFFYSVLANRSKANLKNDNKQYKLEIKNYKIYMKAVESFIDSMEAKSTIEKSMRNFIKETLVSALKYEQDKRLPIREIMIDIKEFDKLNDLTSEEMKINKRVMELLMLSEYNLKSEKKMVKLSCRHMILKDEVIQYALDLFIDKKKYNYLYFCRTCHKVANLRSLPLDCGCLWMKFGKKVKHYDWKKKDYGECEKKKALTVIDLCLLNDYISFEFTYLMSSMIQKEKKYPMSLRKFYSKVNGIKMEEIAWMLKHTNLITTLVLDDKRRYDIKIELVADALKAKSSLKILTLSLHLMKREDIEIFSEILRVNTTLEVLELTSFSLGKESSQSIYEALKVNKNISHLEFCSGSLNIDEMKTISEVLKVSKTVKSLAFNIGVSKVEEMNLLCKGLKDNKTLTRFELIDYKLQVETIKIIAELLKANKTIKYLDISSNGVIEIDSVVFISEALKVNKRLKQLILNDNTIKGMALKSICEALQINKVVTRLSINNIKFDPDDINYISELLKVNKALKELNIRGNCITYKGTIALTEALKINKFLKVLDLRDNKIDTTELYKGLLNNTTLTELRFDYNKNDEAIRNLLKENKAIQFIC